MRIPKKFGSLATPARPAGRAFALALALFCLSAMQPVSAQSFFVNTDVDISTNKGNETDPAVAVNPNTPTNVFVVGVASAITNGGLFTTYTTNFNFTNATATIWITNIVAPGTTNTNTLIPASATGQPSAAWDAAGNLFLAYVPTNSQGIAVAVSTNSGKSFLPLTYLATNDVTVQPRITAGPPLVASATNNVWLVYRDNSLDPPSLVAVGLQTINIRTNVASPIPGAGTNITDVIGTLSIALSNATVGTNVLTITNNQLVVGTQSNSPITLTTNTLIVAENGTNLSTNTFNTNTGFATTITPTTNSATPNTNCITNYAILSHAIGSFSNPEVIPSSSAGGFPDIATGPSNQVMVAYQNNIFSSGTSSVFVSVNTNTLLTNGFGSPVTVANNAVGGFTYIPADESADGINAAVGVAWDQNPLSLYYGRAYVAYTSVGASGVPSMNVSSCYSTNKGAKWSSPLQVNDDTDTYSHFFPRIAVDPATGSVALCWYDCRNDTGNYPADNPVYTVVNAKAMTTNMYTNVFDLDGTANDDYMVYGTTSLSGGTSFAPNLPTIPFITATTVPAAAAGAGTAFTYVSETDLANNANGVGHHIGLAYAFGNIFPVWADNSYFLPPGGTPSNPDASPLTNFDFYLGFSQLPTANLAVYITISPTNPISDESLTYYIVVTNLGPFSATNVLITNILSTNVQLANVNPGPGEQVNISNNGQLLIFSFANPNAYLTNGQSITNSIVVTAVQAGVATNVASAGALIPNPNPAQVIATNVVTIGAEDLALSMSASPTNVDIGSLVTYTLIVSNLGPAANGLIYITNTFPTNLTQVTNVIVSPGGGYSVSNNTVVFSLGTLGVNQSATNYFSATAVSLGSKYQYATNIAFVTGTDYDTNLSNNYATNIVTILGEDLAVGLSATPTNVNIGDTITYTLNITNLGASTSGTVSFTNLLSDNVAQLAVQSISPPTTTLIGSITQTANILNFNIGELGDNQVFTMIYTAVARSVNATDTNVISVVTVSATDFDTNLANNIAEAQIVTINGEDLAIGVSASPTTAWTNLPITYTDMVTNFGPSTNGVINVTNMLSANLIPVASSSYIISGNNVIFQVGTLNAGQTTNLVFTAIPTSVGTATDVASLGSGDFDTNLFNNTNVVMTPVIVPAPAVTNFSVTAYASSAFISWTTAANAEVQVAYGPTTNYGGITSLSSSSTNHVVLLTGLPRNATNYFSALSWWIGESPYTNPYTINGSFFTSNTLILNTGDAVYAGTTTWLQGSSAVTNYYGSYFNVANTTQGNPTASATYTPTIPTPGLYNVYTWYPTNGSFSTNTQMYVSGVTNTVIDSVNQTTNVTTNGQSWQQLAANLVFVTGTGDGMNDNTIIYNDTGDASKLVAANAMMWTYVSNQDYAPGTVPAWWSTWWSNYLGTNITASTSNYDAYVLGVPPDASTSLKFWVTFPTSNTVTAWFSPYQGGRTYQLQATTNLSSLQWSNLTLTQPNIATNAFGMFSNGTGNGFFTTNFSNSTQTFFRLSVGLSTNY